MTNYPDLTTAQKATAKGNRKVALAAGVLFIFYAVGFVGLGFSPYRSLFQALVPFNLLLTNGILFAFHRDFNRAFWLFAGGVAVIGFLAEVLGVHTGLLFGDYRYGPTLGLKLWDVPLLIGVNWLMLTYSAGHLVDWFKWPRGVRALLAAGLMVGLDFLIEPVAVAFDFWSWGGGHIPLSNYLGWFGLAFLLQLWYQYVPFWKTNSLAPLVFLLQVLFFGALLFVL